MIPSDEVDQEFDAQPASLAAIRRATLRAAETAGLPSEQAQLLQIAVGEAATNVVEHAYGAADGRIRLRTYRQGPHFYAEVHDDGQWRAGAAREMAGRGLVVMRGLVDQMDIVRTPSGTTVRLAVKIP
jgi:anti-sigma regulatory factor (Ser/Thr protein kinase)